MVLLIAYDLKELDKDYSRLYETIQHAGTTWWHYIESIWIIDTNLTIDECSNLLRSCMGINDFLLVIDITNRDYQGWLPSKAWSVLNRLKVKDKMQNN